MIDSTVSLNYNETQYGIVSSSNLVKATDLGLFPEGGFDFRFRIYDERLTLEYISGYPEQPKGWLDRLKNVFLGYPPTIGGVKPSIEKGEEKFNREKTGSSSDFIWYDKLSLPWNFSGSLTGICSSMEWIDVNKDDVNTFCELITFVFEKGKLKSTNVVKGNTPKPVPPKRPGLVQTVA